MSVSLIVDDMSILVHSAEHRDIIAELNDPDASERSFGEISSFSPATMTSRQRATKAIK
jgi:hypothetical protein